MTRPLDGKNILLGVSGGIACYKGAEIVRLLVQRGAKVRVMMTRNAMEFIAPLTLQTLSGQPVATETFDLTQESEIGHIRLADTSDAIVVAPATANTIGKVANGLGDDLLTTVLLATRAPVLMAPSMNVHMYENAIVQRNLSTLREHGIRVIEPEAGFLACGYEGAGRLADPSVIVAEVERAVTRQDWRGERVVVSAGPNREALDPVRFISNRSTGKMGYAIAAAAWRRGADVCLVSGPTALSAPHGVRLVNAVSAEEMLRAIEAEWETASVVIMSAAVADYRPKHRAAQKLKKGEGPMSLELERTTDILAHLAPRKGSRFVVGFAAETENVIGNAERKLQTKQLDMIVANDVARADAGFAVDTNAVTILDGRGRTDLPLASKNSIADQILDHVSALRRGEGKGSARQARVRALHPAGPAPRGRSRRRA